MKRSWNLIASLVGLCVLIALIALFQPNRSGMVLSYMTIGLACVVGVLCLGCVLRLLSRDR